MKGKTGRKKKTALILHNIRSVYNVGSIFRTADAVGISKVYLTGYTPTPLDRFGRKRKDFHKTALGAEDSVPWEQVLSPQALLKRLRGEGFFLAALEQSPRAVRYKKFTPKFPLAVVFGNEVRGVSPQLLALCDAIVEIPMRGKKESLNVAVAAGVLLFHLLD